jgi:hypothetical protein
VIFIWDNGKIVIEREGERKCGNGVLRTEKRCLAISWWGGGINGKLTSKGRRENGILEGRDCYWFLHKRQRAIAGRSRDVEHGTWQIQAHLKQKILFGKLWELLFLDKLIFLETSVIINHTSSWVGSTDLRRVTFALLLWPCTGNMDC